MKFDPIKNKDVDSLFSTLRKKKPHKVQVENTNKDQEFLSPYITKLLDACPFLINHPDYLYFMNSSGGLYIQTEHTSIGLYGFLNTIVPDVLEEPLLESEGFFIFGDVLNLKDDDDHISLSFNSIENDTRVYARNINSNKDLDSWQDFYTCLAFFMHSLD